jgi:hypothetical protein
VSGVESTSDRLCGFAAAQYGKPLAYGGAD